MNSASINILGIDKSIVVLPFKNLSGDNEYEYFSDGITEEIINALAKIEGLRVIARTSAFSFKGKSTDIRIIGNELGVTNAVEGSIRISKDRIRISAQLTRTDNGYLLWSEKFDRKLNDVFELQDEISLLIADKIRENFGHFDVTEHLVKEPTKNLNAYKHLLKGRELRMRWNSEGVYLAINEFEKSIKLDPSYADAHFEKGWCIAMLASWGYWEREEGLAEANHHIEIGLKLNPNSSIGHYAKGTISFWGYWNYKDAFVHMQKSLEINPNYSEVRDSLADMYSGLGKIDDALHHNEIARRINPLSANLHYTNGNMLYFKRNFNEALIQFDKALKLNPTFNLVLEMKAATFIFDNNGSSLEKLVSNTPQLQRPKTYKAIFNLINDNRFFNITETEVEEELASTKELSLRAWDLYYETCRGNHKKALQILKERILTRSGQLFNFRNDLFLYPLHNYQEYKDIESSIFHESFLPHLEINNRKQTTTTFFEDDEINSYVSVLENEMMVNKHYLNSNLSLKELAEIINLHPNKLSRLLNSNFDKNFNDFINQYRIKEFQNISLDPKNSHLTILGLAYDSGFNSKTVFNTYFKKVVGVTPKKWLISQKK